MTALPSADPFGPDRQMTSRSLLTECSVHLPGLEASALDKLNHNHDDGDNQDEVDQPTTNVERECAQKPQDDQNSSDREKHGIDSLVDEKRCGRETFRQTLGFRRSTDRSADATKDAEWGLKPWDLRIRQTACADAL